MEELKHEGKDCLEQVISESVICELAHSRWRTHRQQYVEKPFNSVINELAKDIHDRSWKEQLKEYQESLFKSGMVVMKDGKVVKLEDFFIMENTNEKD